MMKFNSERIRKNNVLANLFVLFSFILLSFLSISIISPIVSSNASEQSSETEVGSYTMSMSNDNVATIDITPTSSQQVFEGSNDITLTNTCPAGATITMSTVSSVDNSLERIGSDNKTKTINATSTSNGDLDNNTWGYSINDGSSYSPVPLRNAEPATIYDEERARTSSFVIPITFGVKTDNTLPSGFYSTDIIYTITPKAGCLTYSVTWDFNDGTAKPNTTYPTTMNFSQTLDLSSMTPTRDGYTFTGWSNGSDTFTGEETDVNINPNSLDTITLTAQWRIACTENCTEADLSINESIGYDYTGAPVGVTLKKAGRYKLEVWGAQGGNIQNNSNYAGYGGYSYGVVSVASNAVFYVYVGGQGSGANNDGRGQYIDGGWNGGGGRHTGEGSGTYNNSGGGATDISLQSGLWDSVSHLYSRIIVAGGGGGNGQHSSQGFQGAGGGYEGGHGLNYSDAGSASNLTGREAGGYGTQNAADVQGGSQRYIYIAAAFGRGGTGYSTENKGWGGHGGGGGWYGGGNGGDDQGGGGGSGYIYNSSSASNYPGNYGYVNSSYYLSDAGMYMYCLSSATYNQCKTSNDAGTKTSSGGNVSSTATSNYAKQGNGYAKITYLGTSV